MARLPESSPSPIGGGRGEGEPGDEVLELVPLEGEVDDVSADNSSASSSSSSDELPNVLVKRRTKATPPPTSSSSSSISRLQQQSILGQASRRDDAKALQNALFAGSVLVQGVLISGFLLVWTDQIFLLIVLMVILYGVLKLGRELVASLLSLSPGVFARASCPTLGFIDFLSYVAMSTSIGLTLQLAATLFAPNPAQAALALAMTFFLLIHWAMWLTSTFGVFSVTSLRRPRRATAEG